MRFLLDTNTVSELLRPQADRGVLSRYQQGWAQCAVPTPVLHEILYGTARMADRQRARALEARYERLIDGSGHALLPYDSEAARWHAVERARLGRAGLTPAFVDSQIAAIAATRNLTLVTRNTRDFECFDGLRLENWFEAGKD